MPSVGTAYVNIRVNTKGFEAGLDRMLARLSKKMEAQGKSLGDSFTKGLQSSNVDKFFTDMERKAQTSSTKIRGEFKKVEGALDNVGLTASDAGGMIDHSFSSASGSLRGVRNDLTDVSRAARTVEKDAGIAGRAVSGIGGGAGRGIRSAANDMGFFGNALSNMSKAGVGVREFLNDLHDRIALLSSAGSGVIGALSSAGQAIFAVGAQAAAAAPALGVFAAGLIGIGQVGGVLAIAMHGVGAAISAGFKSVAPAAKSATGSTQALANAVQSAARGVRDAKQALQDAYAQAARSAADAARRTLDAEQALAASEKNLTDVQKGLNAAREEGLNQLKEIGFAAEEAGLSEQRAALNLQDARMKLQAVSELPPDDRARVEAELAYKEAELQYREAKNNRKNADEDQKESVKKGLQGTDAMVQQHQKEHDAAAQVTQDKKNLADARRNEAQVAQDNAKAIAKAQQSLADAEKNLADARKKGTAATSAATTALDNYNAALKKLSPNQQQFVRDVIKLKGEFTKARNAIADPLFGHLDTAMKDLVGSPFWNQIVGVLSTTSSELGKLVSKGEEAAKKPPFSTALLSTMKSNNKLIGTFGDTAGNLANSFVQIADASGPVLKDFAEWTKKVTGAWSQTLTMDNKTGKLDATIKRAGDRVKVFKDFFVELWHWLRIVGGAATNASENFKWTYKGADKKGFIPMLTQHLKDFNAELGSKGRTKRLVDDFHTALANTAAAGRALKSAVIDPLLILGRDKHLKPAFDNIARSDAFKRLANNGGEAVVQLSKLITAVADIAATLSESGSFATFIGDLSKVANVISGFLDKVPLPVLKTLGTVLGTLAAIRVTTTLGTKLVQALTPPGLDKLPQIPGKIRGAADKAVKAGTALEEAGLEVAAKFETGFAAGMKEVGVQMLRAAKAAMPKTGMVAAGSEFVAGLTVGIEEATPAVKLAVEEMCKSMIAMVRTTLKMKSPSAVAVADGLNFSESFAQGIAEGAPAAEAAAAEMSTGAAGALGAGTATAKAEGAAMATAAVPAGGGVAGAVAAEAGPVGKFAGILGKFGKFAGPLTKMMKPLSLGIRAIGGAMRFAMGPWGMLILTLLPILLPLLKKLNDKFHLTDKAMAALKWTLDKLVDGWQWLWDKITAVFGWIKDHWPLLLGILTGPIGLAVALIIKHWKAIWNTVTKFVGLIVNKIRGIWNGIINAWQHVQTWMNNLWSHHIKPWILGLLQKVHDQEWKWFHGIMDAWTNFWQWLGGLWSKKIKPWIVGLLVDLGNQELKFFHGIYDAWQSLWTWLRGLWSDHIHPWLTGLVSDFSTGISKIWQGLIDGFYTATNWITSNLNKYLIHPINGILGKLHVGFTIGDIGQIGTKKQLAGGGPVDGPGTETSDSIPAMLSRGEYVVRAAAARKVGIPVLNAINQDGILPMGDPGLFSSIGHAFSTVAGAIKDSATTAIKWVLSKAESFFSGGDVFSRIARGLINTIVDNAVSFIHGKEQAQIAKAGGGASVSVSDPSNPHSLATWHGGTFTRRFIAHLQKAQQLAGTQIVVIQGGFRPATSYSGTSHQGDAIDTRVVYSVLYALRRVGIAAGDRTGLGNWAPHIHAIPGPSAGYAAGSAVWQWTDYIARGGAKQSPRSPWGLAMGGVVHPSPGGTIVKIAEAGRAERVTPLDSEGMTPAERRILASLEAQFHQTSGGDTYNVHPAPGMNETELADKVARRVAWKRRRGAGTG